MSDRAAALLAEIAAQGLPGATARSDELVFEDAEWSRLVAGAQAQGITGFLVQAINDGRVTDSDERRRAARDAHHAAASWTMLLEQTLLEVVGAWLRAGIDSRVLKGPALARLLYTDPSVRTYRDVDLLVPSASMDDAVELLVASGARRMSPELRRGFDRRFGKAVALASAAGPHIDVHRTLATGRFGMYVPTDALFATSEPFVLGRTTVSALAAEERFLHACYHAAVGDPVPRLMTLRDVAQMLLLGDLDGDRVRELAESWKARPVLARAVETAWHTLALVAHTELSAWCASYEPSASERWAIRASTSRRSGTAAHALTTVGAVHGLRAKAAYLRGLALPDAQFLEGHRHRRYATWWRQGARSVLRLVGR